MNASATASRRPSLSSEEQAAIDAQAERALLESVARERARLIASGVIRPARVLPEGWVDLPTLRIGEMATFPQDREESYGDDPYMQSRSVIRFLEWMYGKAAVRDKAPSRGRRWTS